MRIRLALLPLLLAGLLHAEEKPKKTAYVVMQVTDMTQGVTFSVVTAEDAKPLLEAAKLATFIYPKAVAAADKKWKSDADLKKYVFPRAALTPPKAVAYATLPNEEKANEKKAECEKKEAEAAARKEKMKKPAEKTKEGQLSNDEILAKAVEMVTAELAALKNELPGAGNGKKEDEKKDEEKKP